MLHSSRTSTCARAWRARPARRQVRTGACLVLLAALLRALLRADTPRPICAARVRAVTKFKYNTASMDSGAYEGDIHWGACVRPL